VVVSFDTALVWLGPSGPSVAGSAKPRALKGQPVFQDARSGRAGPLGHGENDGSVVRSRGEIGGVEIHPCAESLP